MSNPVFRANPDRDLIRLCKQTVEALKADLAFLDEKDKFEKVFDEQCPAYPSEAGKWRCSGQRETARELRVLARSDWAKVTPTYRAKLRVEIKAVAAWERRAAAIRKTIGLRAAELKGNRIAGRVHALMARVIETPAHTFLGIAAKAAIIEHWRNDGYDLHDGGDGAELVQVILDEIRLLGTGGNNGGRFKVSRVYDVVDQEAPMLAAAA